MQYKSLKSGMLKALKKNQIIIFAIALMLITAGYLSYTMSTEQTAETSAKMEQDQYAGIGDARLVSNDNVVDDSDNDEAKRRNETSAENNVSNENKDGKMEDEQEISQEEIDMYAKNEGVGDNWAKEASSKPREDLDSYYTESRLERDKMYSEMLESYQSMLANQGVSAEQKSSAQTEISNINKQKNAIMIAENLIKNKGFKDVIIFVNNESVSAVVRAENMETADIAQVQSIIQRELNVKVENIHISNK